MMTPFDATSLTTTVGGIDITIETGKYARQASGAVTITSGNTVILVTSTTQPLKIDRGFFPLTCNYQEMAYAAGRVPGNYFRREGRPSERETLIYGSSTVPFAPCSRKVLVTKSRSSPRSCPLTSMSTRTFWP